MIGNDDETAFECSKSKLYLDDFVDARMPLAELAKVGWAYAMYLRKALLDSPVRGTFRIIVDVQLPDSGHEGRNSCSVRVHRVRPEQPWLADDLESYKENAILVHDFRKDDLESRDSA